MQLTVTNETLHDSYPIIAQNVQLVKQVGEAREALEGEPGKAFSSI